MRKKEHTLARSSQIFSASHSHACKPQTGTRAHIAAVPAKKNTVTEYLCYHWRIAGTPCCVSPYVYLALTLSIRSLSGRGPVRRPRPGPAPGARAVGRRCGRAPQSPGFVSPGISRSAWRRRPGRQAAALSLSLFRPSRPPRGPLAISKQPRRTMRARRRWWWHLRVAAR